MIWRWLIPLSLAAGTFAASVETNAPVKNFSLPTFTKEGYRSVLLRGNEALFDRLPEPLICVREVSAAGRSTARIDDESVTAARLASVAGRTGRLQCGHHVTPSLAKSSRR